MMLWVATRSTFGDAGSDLKRDDSSDATAARTTATSIEWSRIQSQTAMGSRGDEEKIEPVAASRRATHSHGPGALERGVRLWRLLDGRAGRCVPAPAVRSLPLSLARTRGIRCEGRLFPFTRVGPGARHRLMTRRRITSHHHRPHASACGPVVGARAEHRAKGAAHAIALSPPRGAKIRPFGSTRSSEVLVASSPAVAVQEATEDSDV